MLRAAYMAQEFLTTFTDHIEAVILKPGTISGVFAISVDDQLVFDRKANGGFIEIKELKQLLRDKINPGMSLGHSDKK
ncbi:SelT/SelW/SelH family protein [Niabella hibiscisoli]|nr:SelT/SelW/SelH family protein [Niabella hibiscisoli]